MKLKYFYHHKIIKTGDKVIKCYNIGDKIAICSLIRLFRWNNKMKTRPRSTENFNSLQMKIKYKLKFLNKTFNWTFQNILGVQWEYKRTYLHLKIKRAKIVVFKFWKIQPQDQTQKRMVNKYRMQMIFKLSVLSQSKNKAALVISIQWWTIKKKL